MLRSLLNPVFESVSTDALTIGGVDSDLHWQEDGNSTKSASGVTSLQYTISDTKDIYFVIVEVTNTGGGDEALDIQVNGDSSSNYNYVDDSGSTTTGSTQWDLVGGTSTDRNTKLLFYLNGRWGSGGQSSISNFSLVSGNLGNILKHGLQTGVSSPLDTFTVKTAGTVNHDFNIQVFGRDLA